jgi:hypothetical protein
MSDPIPSELVETVQLLRELQAKATPGPYRAHDHNDMARLGEDPEKWMGYAWVGRITKQSEPDGRFDAGWLDRDSRKDASKEYRERASVDAHFVAEALNALPALLDLIERLTSAPVGEVRREQYSHVDDETIRAFIDGWNARLDYTDFDLALHFWMLSQVTQIGTAELATAPSPSPVARVPDREEIARAVCIATGDDFDAFGRHWNDSPCAEAADAILALFTASPSDGSGEARDSLIRECAERAFACAAPITIPQSDYDDGARDAGNAVLDLLPNPPSFSSETSGDDVGGGGERVQ